jgi:hypothetical protein
MNVSTWRSQGVLQWFRHSKVRCVHREFDAGGPYPGELKPSAIDAQSHHGFRSIGIDDVGYRTIERLPLSRTSLASAKKLVTCVFVSRNTG